MQNTRVILGILEHQVNWFKLVAFIFWPINKPQNLFYQFLTVEMFDKIITCLNSCDII